MILYDASQSDVLAEPSDDVGIAAPYRTYDRGYAAWYGKTYTSESSGTSSYNSLFASYSADCQNFVSQCIWHGFGGINSSTYIENHSLPMLDGWTGATNWWADKDGTDANWKWTYVPYFSPLQEPELELRARAESSRGPRCSRAGAAVRSAYCQSRIPRRRTRSWVGP